MEGKQFLLFILFQGMINTNVFAFEGNSTSFRSAFFVTKENKRLKGHVVKRFESPSLLSCSYECMGNKWCTSTNFKLSSKNDGRGTCELNNHDISLINDKTVFHEQEGVTFSMYFKVNISLTTLLHEIFATLKFRDFFAILKKSRNLSDANNKCREHNMTRILSDSHMSAINVNGCCRQLTHL